MEINNEELSKDLEEQYAMLEEEIQEDKKKKRYLLIFIFFMVMFLFIFGTSFSYFKLYEGTKNEEKYNLIKDLYVEGYEDAFDFNYNIHSYYLKVKNGTTSVAVKVLLNDPTADVEIIGEDKLVPGLNEVIVKVTDKDNNEIEYKIFVVVDESDEEIISNLGLKNLNVTNHELNEKFNTSKFNYVVDDIKNSEDMIKVNFEVLDLNTVVRLKLNDAEVTRNPNYDNGKYSLDLYVGSELVLGANKLEIKLIDKDGQERNYYLVLIVEKVEEVRPEIVEIIVEYGNVDGSYIIANIIPGWESEESQKIKVTNKSNYDVNIDINWTEVTNDFVNKTDLEYYLYKDNTLIKKGVLPSKTENLANGIKVSANSVNNYYIKYKYIYSEKDQNIDQGKTFMSKLHVGLTK